MNTFSKLEVRPIETKADGTNVFILRSYDLGSDGDASQNDIVAAGAETFLDRISKLELGSLLQCNVFEVWKDGVLQGQSDPTVRPFSDKVILLKLAEFFVKLHS